MIVWLRLNDLIIIRNVLLIYKYERTKTKFIWWFDFILIWFQFVIWICLFVCRKKLIELSFVQPRVRLGNKSYTQSELERYRKRNHRRYNQEVRYNDDNSEYTSFYNTTMWRRTREQVLIRDNYMCQHCLAEGIVNDKNLIVHHKIELKRDWSKRLDMENLEAVCFSCHNKIHK